MEDGIPELLLLCIRRNTKLTNQGDRKMKRLIGDKRFYKMILTIALPIMVQNGITNFVGLLDNIMVGQRCV